MNVLVPMICAQCGERFCDHERAEDEWELEKTSPITAMFIRDETPAMVVATARAIGMVGIRIYSIPPVLYANGNYFPVKAGQTVILSSDDEPLLTLQRTYPQATIFNAEVVPCASTGFWEL